MVVKAIINAIGKTNKPKKFPIGTEKFTKQESKTLLEEAQGKIEKIQSGEAKAIETISRGDDYLSVKTSTIAPNLQPKKVNYKVSAPKSSSKKAVDEFLTEEEKVLKSADFDGNESDILNFNKIQSSDDVLAGIRVLGNQYSKSIKKQTRGVVSWKETNELATLLGNDPDTLVANFLKLNPGSALNAHEIKAAKNLLITQHQKLQSLRTKLLSEGGDNTLNALEFARQHALTAELTKIYKGVQTETARALNIMKEPNNTSIIKNINLDQLNRKNILMNLGGKEQIIKIAELYGETPGLVNKIKFAEKSFGSKTSDALVEIFLNNILIGPMTHVKNIGGNWIYKAMERTERKIAARMYGGSTIDSVAEYEDVAAAFGEHLAATNMFRAFSQKWKSVKPLASNPLKTYKNAPGVESQIAGTKFESPVNAFSSDAFGVDNKSVLGKFIDVSGRILTVDRLPYKFLQNADNYFKNSAYQSELYALAFRDTLKQIKMGNLNRSKGADYLAALVTNPDETMTKLAFEAAQRRTFQTPLSKRNDVVGDLTGAVQNLKNVKALNPITIISSQYFTFLRTPGNIAGGVLERSPGANRILRSHREALKKGGADAEIAKAKSVMGWAFMATFIPLGYFGTFHGSDPDVRGRKKYELKKAANKQPKSFRFHNFLTDEIQELTGLTGSKLQVSLNGFEPAIMLAAMAADIGAIINNMQEDFSGWENIHKEFYDFLTAYAVSFGDNLLNTTVLNGAGRLSDLVSNMKMSNTKSEVIAKEGKKIISGMVPFTMLLSYFDDLGSEKIETENYGLVNKDDFRKLNIEFLSMIRKNIPGLENDLFIDRDWLGLPVPKFGFVSSMEEHPVNVEAAKVGYSPIKPRKKMMVTAYSIENEQLAAKLDYGIQVNVPLKENEYAIYAYLVGNHIRADLTVLINSADYINEVDKTAKLESFKDAVEMAKINAKEDFKNTDLYAAIEARAEIQATEKWMKKQGDLKGLN
ncbi:hypothetical protein ACIJYB_03965 [Candidatus Pelagibacter bacterium nBUS_44]|uniref:hypothetical protein n=1 Tax=Candidatus Pelagibacter bacterium nBUS_44 TaxID=3374195 RepID=UPI003EC07B9D